MCIFELLFVNAEQWRLRIVSEPNKPNKQTTLHALCVCAAAAMTTQPSIACRLLLALSAEASMSSKQPNCCSALLSQQAKLATT
jgi:hypothetical protein